MSIQFIAMFTVKHEAAKSEQRCSQVEIDDTRLQGISCQKNWLACIIYASFIKCHWDALHFIWSLAVIPAKQVCHLSWCRLKRTALFKLIRNFNICGKLKIVYFKDEPLYLHFKFIKLKTWYVKHSFSIHSPVIPNLLQYPMGTYSAVHKKPLNSLILKKMCTHFSGETQRKIPFPPPDC